jgi:hypothetical protein
MKNGPGSAYDKMNMSVVICDTDFRNIYQIRVITKLPNSEQSYKGKVKAQVYKQTKSVNNRKTVKNVITLTWYRHL